MQPLIACAQFALMKSFKIFCAFTYFMNPDLADFIRSSTAFEKENLSSSMGKLVPDQQKSTPIATRSSALSINLFPKRFSGENLSSSMEELVPDQQKSTPIATRSSAMSINLFPKRFSG
ncbi:unnamed protein product [Larinioides sclopetarius]